MADTTDEKAAHRAGAASTADDSADSERRLARYAAMGIPAATVGGAIAMNFVVGLGPAILVLAAGTLLGVIALLWASLRTLSGDAPLPVDLEAIAIRSRKVDNLGEQKRRVLRALKDLELEHSVGKIDDKDYASLGDRFRGEAKALMREMDEQMDPFRDEAERLAKKHLDKRGLGELDAAPKAASARDEDDVDEDADESAPHAASLAEREPEPEVVRAPSPPPPPPPPPRKTAKRAPRVPAEPGRLACPKCDTSNEADATFCKKCGTSLTTEESHV